MSNVFPLAPSNNSMAVNLDDDEPDIDIDPAITAINDDGSVVVNVGTVKTNTKDTGFDENLATVIPETHALAETLMEGIEADINSRSEWEATRSQGISLLGLRLEEPRGDVGTSASPLEGMSTVRNPLLLEAILRGWANTVGELLPAEGPVKIKNTGAETEQTDELAEAFEKDFNAYLTNPKVGYYPDTSRAIFWSRFGGSHFKKVYHDPIRRMPVSEAVDANDIIISNSAASFESCGRVTHRVQMRPSTMKRMQMMGIYVDIDLLPPSPQQNQVDAKKEETEGVRSRQDRPEDQPFTLYECYTECQFPDKYVKGKFEEKKIPVPYRVTIEKDSRAILEIRRNWKQDDEKYLPKRCFVKYPFVDAMGFYGIGLLQILGNATRALTAAWREALDAGMFANFPGGLSLKSASRQNTNEFRVAPGSFPPIDSTVDDIRKAVMPLPYKDITPGLMQLIDKITEASQRVGGTADMPVGEGRQDAPVGTTLALIEQATKVEAAVHKGLHAAQADEFQMLKELFKDDPEAFWMHNSDCSRQWDETSLLQALNSCHLVPVADPNTPSHMHRLMKAMGLVQLLGTPAFGPILNATKVLRRVLRMVKIDDADDLINPPAPQGPPQADPNTEILAQTKLAAINAQNQKTQVQATSDAQENASRERIANLNLAKEVVIHSASDAHDSAENALDRQQELGTSALNNIPQPGNP